jgi:hypothetical protein
MGYYSEVAIGMTKKAHEKFIAFLTGEVLKGSFSPDDESPFEVLNNAEKTEYEDAVVYKWDSIKWYQEFKSIAAIKEALNNLDCSNDSDEDDEEDGNYIFVRVGEEADDIETDGYFPGPPYIYPQTTIIIDN